ncbi:hypothetical protein ACFQNE_07155 [Gordonia phosphorivorans]|uniref:Uncharacterized protein n=1 Tax=Gordonia phosphorivorans TaxID=1056982 RepID=A0ABV6H4B8_9ACTN
MDLSLAAAASAVFAGKLPGPVTTAMRKLNELGQVHVSPTEIAFDGTVVPWSAVVSVQLHDTAALVPSASIDKEVDKIRKLLPPFPARKFLVGKMVDGLLVLILSALERSSADPRPVPCQIIYRNKLGQTREVSGGLFAAAALTTVTNLAECIVATAHAHRIPVYVAADSAAVDRGQRAQQLRAAAAAIRGRIQQEGQPE